MKSYHYIKVLEQNLNEQFLKQNSLLQNRQLATSFWCSFDFSQHHTNLSPHLGKEILDKDAMIADSERLIQLAQLQDSIHWLIQYVDSFVENLQSDKEVS